MACLRRRVKRGVCLVLVCYVTILLFNVYNWSDGVADVTNAGGGQSSLGAQHQKGIVSKRDKGTETYDDDLIYDGGEQGGSEKRLPNSVLLPKDLDLAIQNQPETRKVRKKLSQPQQANVVVEDAPPGALALGGASSSVKSAKQKRASDLLERGRPGDAPDSVKPGDLNGSRKSGDVFDNGKGGDTLGSRKAGDLLDNRKSGDTLVNRNSDDGKSADPSNDRKSGGPLDNREADIANRRGLGDSIVDSRKPDTPDKRDRDNSRPLFQDLQYEVPLPELDRRVHELHFEGERELHRGNSNKQGRNKDDPQGGNSRGEAGARNIVFEPGHDVLAAKTGQAGVWLSPDGNPDDLNADSAFNSDNFKRPNMGTTPNPYTPAPPITAAMLNITVSRTASNFREIADVSIYSAFYDHRGKDGHVRMMALGPLTRRPSNSNLWCVFSGKQAVDPVRVVLHQTVDCKRMKKYCFYMLTCQVPRGASFSPEKSDNSIVVVIGKRENNFLNQSGERIRLDVIVNKKRPPNQLGPRGMSASNTLFSVCVPPLFGKLNVLNFVEFVELNRILGAVHFTFYKFRVSREISRVLTYYEEQGVARVLPWNLPAPNDVFYKGQSVATGDCLYRNMHLFDYVAFHDLDEVFIPEEFTSWDDMFNEMHEQSENVETIAAVYQFFPVLYYASKSATSDSQQKEPRDFGVGFTSEVAKFLTLRNILRTSSASSNLTKMFVRPDRVLELDIHSMVKPITNSFVSYKVDPAVGSVHHYKYSACLKPDGTPSAGKADCSDLFENRVAWNFRDGLIWRTKKVLQELNRFGTSFT